MGLRYQHFESIEKHAGKLGILIAIMVSLGGLAEITPLFMEAHKVRAPAGVMPYDALRLAGKDIYVREGCYLCHSQMIRTLQFETQRYGDYSVASDSVYDRPFQWGSKRTGPDLARIGGKYSDEWHRDHLREPKSVVPGTVMPAYPWLAATDLDFDHIEDDLTVNAALGVPYTPQMIASAKADVKTQASADPDAVDLVKRYPKALARDFDGNAARITEADALIAYLQTLGTLVDFKLYDDKANIR